MIAYCFANNQGYFKAGTFKGNGSADGSYVHLGFRAGMVLMKNSETTDQWQIFDSKRGRNGAIGFSYPDSHEAETASVPMDILSQGIKFRDASSARNDTGYGFYLKGSNNKNLTPFEAVSTQESGLYIEGDSKVVRLLKLKNSKALLVAKNDDFLQLIELKENN